MYQKERPREDDAVRVVRAASEAEVVAAFLRGELDSPRWGERLLELLTSRLPFLSRDELAFRASLAGSAVSIFAVSGVMIDDHVMSPARPDGMARDSRCRGAPRSGAA